MTDHVPGPDGRCVCHVRWRELRRRMIEAGQIDEANVARIAAEMLASQEQDANADGSASPVLTARVYAADSARTVPGTPACCEGGES